MGTDDSADNGVYRGNHCASGATVPLLEGADARAVLERLCREHEISLELLVSLLNEASDHLGKGRASGITDNFTTIIDRFLMEDSQS